MARVTITLKNSERDALVTLAERERRDPRAQAALIVHNYLKRKHLLAVDIVSREHDRITASSEGIADATAG